jgi:2-iminobutanoate/2-iminopropanoate deaminase
MAAAAAALLGGCAAAPQDGEICRLHDPALPRLAPYAAAVAARGLVHLSGVVPVDPATGQLQGADFESQMARVLANLDRALALAGAGRGDVIKLTVYLKSAADFAAMNRLYAAHFGSQLPARTTVPGMDWGRELRVEIDAVAIDRRPRGPCPSAPSKP